MCVSIIVTFFVVCNDKYACYCNRFNDSCFTISHSFSSKTSSSRRTSYCASILNRELKKIHLRYMRINLFKLKLEQKLLSRHDIQIIIEKKFCLDKNSSRFYSLKNLVTASCDERYSIKNTLSKKSVIFSGKSNNNLESDFLLSQLDECANMINIVSSSSPKMNIINTTTGGSYYLGSKFMFVLIPREEAIKFPSPHLFHKCLSVIETKKPKMHSNRGKNRKVFFETKFSNYVDVGVGVSRCSTGLYMKSVRDLPLNEVTVLQKSFSFINNIVLRYIPSSLTEAFSNSLKVVGLDDFSRLPGAMCHSSEKHSVQKIKSNRKLISCQSDILPSASYGRNNLLPLHTDQDMFLSVVHVHCDNDICFYDEERSQSFYQYDSDIVKYFSFDNCTSVALRSGDVLIFNPNIPHCISSCTDSYQKASTYCLSHYFKTSIAGRNDNSLEFNNQNE